MVADSCYALEGDPLCGLPPEPQPFCTVVHTPVRAHWSVMHLRIRIYLDRDIKFTDIFHCVGGGEPPPRRPREHTPSRFTVPERLLSRPLLKHSSTAASQDIHPSLTNTPCWYLHTMRPTVRILQCYP